MFPDSPDVRTFLQRSSTKCANVNRKLMIFQPCDQMFEEQARLFTRSKLVVTALLALFGLLLWSHYQLIQLIRFNLSENYVNSSLNSKNASKTGLESRISDNALFNAKIVTNYCEIKECRTVYCSSISQDSDPGSVASTFINSNLQVECINVESVTLSFSNCKFPGNKLQKNWLSTNVSIDGLIFDTCSLSDIEDNVFSSPIYKEMQKITMVKNRLVSLRKAMFQHLNTLQELTIRENIINQVEFNLFEYVADTLSSLELNKVINNAHVLRNITGASKHLKIQILSLKGNFIPVIDRHMFQGLSAVKSLYIEDSKVATVSLGTLDSMSSSILQLFVRGNDIISLPVGFLDNVLRSRRPFRMAIHDNPWHCNCSLKWMQDLIRSMPNIVISIPVCSTPDGNARKSFTQANFCYESNTADPNTDTTSTKETTEQDLTLYTSQTDKTTVNSSQNKVNLTCNIVATMLRSGVSRRLLTTDYQFHSRFPNFFVSKNTDEGILLKVPDLDEMVTLLWFDNKNVENSLNCAKNVKHSYLLQHIDPEKSYTICLLVDKTSISPFNCLTVTTSPTYESRTWLTNADKSVTFLVLVAAFILLFLLAAFVMYMLIRRHPSLLRGSKRVMFVKRTNVDAIVLPKGVSVDEKEQTNAPRNEFYKCRHEDDYVTPLPPAAIPAVRGSRMSLQSDWHSYVSQFEPTETQLDAWWLTSVSEKRQSEAPPLPPHHPINKIPSVSLAMDTTEERNEYLISTF